MPVWARIFMAYRDESELCTFSLIVMLAHKKIVVVCLRLIAVNACNSHYNFRTLLFLLTKDSCQSLIVSATQSCINSGQLKIFFCRLEFCRTMTPFLAMCRNEIALLESDPTLCIFCIMSFLPMVEGTSLQLFLPFSEN